MRNFVKSAVFILLVSGLIFAQTTDSKTSVEGKSRTEVKSSDVKVMSGTEISGQLKKSLDVKKAEVGDQVILKVRKKVKSDGKTVIKKGSRLIGRVTDVQKSVGEQGSSKISIVFDSLQQGKTTTPITATIVSITQARADVRDDMRSSSQTRSSTSSQTKSSSGGGLLGGVTKTVGGVVNTTTQTVGGVTNSVGQTVGGATEGIQISQSSDTSVSGASTLSLNGENLKLEKGTTFNLRVSESVETKEN